MNRNKLYLTLALLLGIAISHAQSTPGCFSLRTASVRAATGDQICLPVLVSGFDGVLSAQFSLRWDPRLLEFVEVRSAELPGFRLENTGRHLVEEGILTFSWFDMDLEGVSLADGDALFELCLTVKAPVGAVAPVRITDDPTRTEFTNADQAFINDYALISGSVQVDGNSSEPLAITRACGTLASCEAPTGAIDVDVSGGAAPYTFQWHGPNGFTAETEDIGPLTAGLYELTVTSRDSTVVEALVSISGNTPRIVAPHLTPPTCSERADGAIGLGVTGGSGNYEFAWSNGATTRDLEGLAPGTYTLTVTDLLGCSVVDSFELSVDENLGFIYSTVLPSCGEDDGAIYLYARDSLPGDFTFNWSTGANTANLTGLAAGFYSVTITGEEGTCSTAFDIELPTRQLSVELQSECVSDEPEEEVELTATPVSGQAPYTYNWSTGATTSSILVPSGLPFSVTVTDNTGCTAVIGPFTPRCDWSADSLLQLFVKDTLVSSGQPFCTGVRITGFEGVASLQFGMTWDPGLLRWDGAEDFALETNTPIENYLSASEGQLRFAWYHRELSGLDLADSTALFRVCFTTLDTVGASPLGFSGEELAIEAYRGDLRRLPVQTRDAAILIGDEFVWPGDTDQDELVSHFDLLPIGLGFGARGPARAGASLRWSPQPAAAWNDATPGTGIDYRHLDTDGDGLVGPSDTVALLRNWGRRVGEAELAPSVTPRSENGAPLFIQPHEAAPGERAAFEIILGEEAMPATDVYGLAFSILYDTAAVDRPTARVELGSSWLGTPGNDLLTIQRNHPQAGRLDVALTRTDGANRTGFGAIGRLLVTIEDVILIRSDDYEMPFRIDNVRLIDAREQELPVNTPETKAMITGATAVDDPPLARQIRLFPQPAGQTVQLRAEGLTIEAVECYDLTGRRLGYYPGQVQELDVQTLAPGLYLLRVHTDRGVAGKRLLIRR